MKKWLALAVSLALLALAAAGCGSSSKSSGSSSSDTSGSSSQPASSGSGSGGGGKVVKVDMKNIQFAPKDVTVPVGGTVEWSNTDQVSHDVTATGGAKFSSGSGNIGNGSTYKQTFKKAGKVTYVCTVHPGMAGTVTVK